jgi:hypothetical protein
MDGRMVCEHVLATPCIYTCPGCVDCGACQRAATCFLCTDSTEHVLTTISTQPPQLYQRKLSKHGSANAGKILEENGCTPMPVHERRA